MAIRRAYEKLQDPQCQKVFSDFTDASGVTLQQKLDQSDKTAASYLGWLFFYNGDGTQLCDGAARHAFTIPGA